MDPTIKMMLQGYIDSLDSMKPSDAALKQEVEAFKKELTAFAEAQRDAMTFFPKFQDSGLMGKYMDLTTKITLAAQSTGNACAEKPQQKHRTTPAEWLAPFISPELIKETACTGSLLILAIGFNMLEITKFKVIKYLPALVMVPVLLWLEWLWVCL